jgi:hypothetical protein
LQSQLATEEAEAEEGGADRHAQDREVIDDEMQVSVGHGGLPEEDVVKIARRV